MWYNTTNTTMSPKSLYHFYHLTTFYHLFSKDVPVKSDSQKVSKKGGKRW